MSATYQLSLRSDLAANWTSINPVLAAGEPGLETDTRKMKIGNGSTAWNSLPYAYSAPQFYNQATTPAAWATGDLWLDTSTAL